MSFVIDRLPQTDDELYWLVRALWGVTVPRTQVCPDHVAPFTAFADAYFGRNSLDPDSSVTSIALWHGSRGLSGKSYALSILGLTKAFLRGADVNLLGGSLAQSTNIHEHMRAALEYKAAPRYMIDDEGSAKIKLTNRARIRPLTASQRTVRGPHPPFLLLDEIDEMELAILDAALGQPMEQKNYLGEVITPYTVMCSTWQNPEGCVLVGTPITTRRGVVPIEQVVVGDEVPTRDGWKTVSNSINTGQQETVTVTFASGRQLTCTPWHPVWTADGWVKAALLAPGTHVVAVVGVVGDGVDGSGGGAPLPSACAAAPAGMVGRLGVLVPEHRSLIGDVVTSAADVGTMPASGGALVVDLPGDDFEVAWIDARPVCAGPAAWTTGVGVVTEMVQVKAIGDGADDLLPDPPVSQHVAAGVAPVALEPVATVSDAEGPRDAVVGVQVDDLSFTDDEVVQVSHHGMVLPTWDLTVEDTHEYVANGILVHNTFTEIIRRAEDRGIPIYRWCYRESNNKVDGWLSDAGIAEKKASIPLEMWRVEYELGEPSIGNRAFDSEAVEATFSVPFKPIKKKEQKDYEEYVFEAPQNDKGGTYVIGADWAKEQDYTVIAVLRTDTPKLRLAYWCRVNRRPYPYMIGLFNEAMARYEAEGEYDRTGLGNVVNDYIDIRAHGFMMTGDKRASMLSEYVSAVENGELELPKIKSAYLAHKYAQVGDLYSNAKAQGFHLPDEVCALALAYYRYRRNAPPANPLLIPKSGEDNRYAKVFSRPVNNDMRPGVTGEVYVRSADEAGFSLLV